MNLKSLSLSLLIALFIFSCDAVDKLLTFTIDDEVSFTIESNLPLNIANGITTPDVKTNASQEFKNNNTNADLVKDVRLKELRLTITTPANKTFSFLKSIHLYISTNSNDEIELAYLDNINASTNNIALTTSAEKLDKYIKGSSYKIRTVVVTKETVTSDISIKTNMKFEVTADPF